MERKVIIRTGFEICFLGICFAWLLHTPSSLTHTTIIEFINLVLATALVNTEELIIQKLKKSQTSKKIQKSFLQKFLLKQKFMLNLLFITKLQII